MGRAGTVTPAFYGKARQRRAETILAETDELDPEIGLLRGIEVGALRWQRGLMRRRHRVGAPLASSTGDTGLRRAGSAMSAGPGSWMKDRIPSRARSCS
jgi:hypothetical protein